MEGRGFRCWLTITQFVHKSKNAALCGKAGKPLISWLLIKEET